MTSFDAPELARVGVGRTLTIHLTFKPMGWATFYIDDAQGTLAIESDWGSYAYRWGRGPWLGVEPPDLSRALAGSIGDDHDYIARKLFRSKADAYDPEATEREWRSEIVRARREGRCSAEAARDAWDTLRHVDFQDERGAVETAWENRSLRGVITDPVELRRTSKTPWFLTMREVLLPAFVAELRKALDADAIAEHGVALHALEAIHHPAVR